MNEKHPTNENSKTPEPAPRTVFAEPIPQDKLSRMVKDAMATSDGGELFKHILRDKFDITSENIVWFLNYTRIHSEENIQLDAYNLIRARINFDIAGDAVKYSSLDTPHQDLLDKLGDYLESLMVYVKKLGDRQKAINDLFHSLDLIDNPVIRETLSKKCNHLLDVHEEIAFLQYSMDELKIKVEKEKLKQSQIASDGQDDPLVDEIAEMRNDINSLSQSAVSQKEKLDQLHELSKESLIRQEEIKGELPPGGISYLKQLSEETPHYMLLEYIRKLSSMTISPDTWEMYLLNQQGKNNHKIAKVMGIHFSTVFRKLERLKVELKHVGLPLLVKRYGTKKKLVIDPSRTGVGQYSQDVANSKYRDDIEEEDEAY